MTARRRKAKRSPAYWVDWSPNFLELFEPLSALMRDMDPPKRVRVYNGLRHLTVLARFTSADGLCLTAKARVARAVAP